MKRFSQLLTNPWCLVAIALMIIACIGATVYAHNLYEAHEDMHITKSASASIIGQFNYAAYQACIACNAAVYSHDRVLPYRYTDPTWTIACETAIAATDEYNAGVLDGSGGIDFMNCGETYESKGDNYAMPPPPYNTTIAHDAYVDAEMSYYLGGSSSEDGYIHMTEAHRLWDLATAAFDTLYP